MQYGTFQGVSPDAHRQLMERLALRNRPQLNANMETLRDASVALASDSAERSRFVSDPGVFLREHAIHVDSCAFAPAVTAETTEACTAMAACNVGVVVNVATYINVAATALAVLGVAAWIALGAWVCGGDKGSCVDYQLSADGFSFGSPTV